MKIMTIVGARPDFMKAAPIIAAINAHNGKIAKDAAGEGHGTPVQLQHVLVPTGQHYDEIMSGSFFNDLALLKPDGLRSQPGQNGEGKRVARYALLTLHQPANVDNRDSLQNIFAGLQELGKDCPIIFPVHPRAQKRIKEFGVDLNANVDANHVTWAAQ